MTILTTFYLSYGPLMLRQDVLIPACLFTLYKLFSYFYTNPSSDNEPQHPLDGDTHRYGPCCTADCFLDPSERDPSDRDPSDPDLEPLEEVVDLIQCGICYRGFSGHVDPRASPCGHLLCLDCLEGLERAAVPIRVGPKILSCPTCRRLCEKKDFLKLTLSGKSVISSRPQVIIAEELEKVKNTLLNPIIACALEWVEQESERLELVPQIITTNNMIGQLPKFINNFETEARVVKAVAIRNKTRDAINRLDRLIGQLYLQQGVAVCLCVGACQCGGRAPTSKRS